MNAGWPMPAYVPVVMFAVLFSAVTFMSVWTGSSALALIAGFALFFISIVFTGYDQILPQLAPWFRPVFTTLYHTLPNYAEVSQVIGALAARQPVGDWYPLISSVVFAVVAYGAAFWLFRRKDF